MKVGLFGFGKTGRAVASVILNNKDIVLEWVVRKTRNLDHRSAPEFLGLESKEPGLIFSKDDINEVFLNDDLKVDAIIDFSSSESIFEYGEYARMHGITIITAISNYDQNELNYLKGLSKDTRVLWSPNITIGINFLILAAKVLQKISPTADIVVVEEHFKAKPEISGTAKVISKHLNQPEESIKYIRAGGIIGKHEIIFGFPFQTVRLTHDSISREAFGNGALFALKNIHTMPFGLYTMEDILKSYFEILN